MKQENEGKSIVKLVGVAICFFFITSFITMCYVRNNEYTEYKTIVYVLIFITMIIFDVLPITLTCFFSLGMLPLLGLVNGLGEALVGFSNPVIAFIVASFGIVQAISHTSFVGRTMEKFLSDSSMDADKVTWKMMLWASIMSSIVSNVPTCVLFYSMAKKMLDVIPDKKKCAVAKKLMIGIPISSMIGGIITPVGSSVNILAISILAEQTGVEISFVRWMAIGLPVALVAVPVCWLLLRKLGPNVTFDEKETEKFLNELNESERDRSNDIKTLFYIGTMLVFWIASSWIKELNVVEITVIGCAAMCIPRIGVININEVIESINWKSVILLGSVLTIGTLLTRNQVLCLFPCTTLQEFILDKLSIIIYLIVALITFGLLIIVPVAPSLETFWIPLAFMAFGSNATNPALIAVIIAICACNCYLFPFDTVFLVTYGSGYYSLRDLLKISIPLQLCVAVTCSAIVYLNELILW